MAESIVTRLIMQIHGYTGPMETADRKTQGFAQKSQREFQKLNSVITSVGRTLTGIFVTGGLARAAQDITLFADNLGKLSKATGFQVEALQELRFGFGQTGVSATQLDKNLEAFSRRIGAFARDGTGPAAKSLEQLGISMDDIRERTPEQALALVAERMKALRNETLQINVAQDLFSESGRRMVNLLRQGEAALQAYSARARQLGLVLDKDLIANAEELNDRFTETIDLLGVQGKRAFLSVAPAISVSAKAVTDLIQTSGRALEGLRQGLTLLTAPKAIREEWLALQGSAPRAAELTRRKISDILSSPFPATLGGILGIPNTIAAAWEALPKRMQEAISRAKRAADEAFAALSPLGSGARRFGQIAESGGGSPTDQIGTGGSPLGLAALGDTDAIQKSLKQTKAVVNAALKTLIKSQSATVKDETFRLSADIRKAFDQMFRGEGSLEQRFKVQNFRIQESLEQMIQAVEKNLVGERFRFVVNDVDKNLKRIGEAFEKLEQEVVGGPGGKLKSVLGPEFGLFLKEDTLQQLGIGSPSGLGPKESAVRFAAGATSPFGSVTRIGQLQGALNELRQVAALGSTASPGTFGPALSGQLKNLDLALTTEELTESNVKLAESYLKLKGEMDGIRQVGAIIGGTLSTMAQGVRQGTQKMSALWQNFLENTLLGLFNRVFNKLIENVFESLAKQSAGTAIGGILGTLFGPTPATGQHGGVVQVQGFTRGGMVPGFGSGDIVPALLEPREGVINRTGMHLLSELNAGRVPSAFQGAAPIVNVNNFGSRQPEVTTSRAPNGATQIDITIGKMMARDVEGRGPLGQAINNAISRRFPGGGRG